MVEDQTWPSTKRKALTSHAQVQSHQEAGLLSQVPKQETPPGKEGSVPGRGADVLGPEALALSGGQ